MQVKKYLKPLLNKYYITAFLIFFIPRIINLGSDISNYDASYWYPRMDEFTKNILEADYQDTYQKYHPGVTLLWLSGTSKYLFQQAFELVFDYNPRFYPQQFIKLNAASILPLIFVISVLGTFLFALLSKILNRKFAFLFVIVLSLEPFFLGISKYLHLSALTSMFMFASFLSLYYYYFKEKTDKKFFYFSAILLGFGALTKIDAIIVAPINGFIIFLYEYKLLESTKKSAKFHFSWKKLLQIFKYELYYALTAFLTFYLLFPSMWVAPTWTVKKIIGEGIEDTAFNSSGADTLTGIKYLFYPETIIFRSLPTFLLGFIAGTIIYITKRTKIKFSFTSKQNQLINLVFFYILFNILILSIPDKIKDRYLINLYPTLAVIVALFLYYILISQKKVVKYLVFGTFIFFYLLTAYRYNPVYSYYYSDIIGGAKGYEKLGFPIKNRGEYYAQAAQYINETDPDVANKIVIISSREQMRTFPPFFYGTAYANPRHMKDKQNADYILTKKEDDWLVQDRLLDRCIYVRSFGPKNPFGNKALNLYKCEGIDNSYKDFDN